MVERGITLHVPAVRHDTSGIGTVQTVTQCVSDTHSTIPDLSIVVPGTLERNTVSSDTIVASVSRHTDTRRHSVGRIRAGSALPTLGPSRVASLTKIFVAKGHSRRAAGFMVKSLRPSSINLYESHWAAFVRYCQQKSLNVFNVRSAHFSRYLVTLFDAGLLPSTIISHRTSIASVLRHWRYDPATDPKIRLLIRSFRLARPVTRVLMPKWDLQIVLSGLGKPPFVNSGGSDDVIELKWRTVKTVFLLSLASARRRSLLHALSAHAPHILWCRGAVQGQLVVKLLPQPGFLAKNQLPTQVPE